MRDSLYIAWQYLRFNQIKTASLIACITLVSGLTISFGTISQPIPRFIKSCPGNETKILCLSSFF